MLLMCNVCKECFGDSLNTMIPIVLICGPGQCLTFFTKGRLSTDSREMRPGHYMCQGCREAINKTECPDCRQDHPDAPVVQLRLDFETEEDKN